MPAQEVQAKITDGDPLSVQFNFGDTLEEAVGLYGEDVVFSRYKGAAVIDLQAYMRGMIRAGKSATEVTTAVGDWKPGTRQPRGKSSAEKLEGLLAKMSPDEITEILEKYST